MRSFYDYPALYDAIHLPDTPAEMAGMLAAQRRRAVQEIKREISFPGAVFSSSAS